MLLREFKEHFERGDLDEAVGVISPEKSGYYLLVKSRKWGVQSFLESGKAAKPRVFKTQYALMNAAQSIGFQCSDIHIHAL
ncbi:hypothetical protein [Vibrio sp. THAF190c]|uniref:hypothetical protein n=1 Tax=Vibrio sp. THAF190c TaxID=2587865 RepID=UPI001267E164|nr:hypothetical protein [Vibrio sp. THAF190c]QFT11749.1 hypothetical protein FIV04_17645 [Vibrio sp. THAF190c]